jgi:hypothetical protein
MKYVAKDREKLTELLELEETDRGREAAGVEIEIDGQNFVLHEGKTELTAGHPLVKARPELFDEEGEPSPADAEAEPSEPDGEAEPPKRQRGLGRRRSG